MVTENGQGMGGHGAGRNMKDGRQQFAGDLEHVGNHKEQALGGGERRCQGAGGERTVDSTGGAGFGLHFPDGDGLAEDVFQPLGRPFIRYLAHGRRRRDGINGRRVA